MTNYNGTVALDVASQLVTGIATTLAIADRGVDRVFVTVGDVAWDNCECGQLSVSVLRTVTSATFPGESSPFRHCGDLVIVEFSIALVRCQPGSDINGNPPKPAALTAAAGVSLLDMADVRATTTSVLCALEDASIISDYFVGEQISLGPLGVCGGSQLVARVAFTHCLAC